MLAKMRKLDGSVESSVSLLTGLSPERIKELGGVGDSGASHSDILASRHVENAGPRQALPVPGKYQSLTVVQLKRNS
jgi:hypothetical protein